MYGGMLYKLRIKLVYAILRDGRGHSDYWVHFPCLVQKSKLRKCFLYIQLMVKEIQRKRAHHFQNNSFIPC